MALVNTKKIYMRYRRHRRELKRKYGEYNDKTRRFLDKSGLSEMGKCPRN